MNETGIAHELGSYVTGCARVSPSAWVRRRVGTWWWRWTRAALVVLALTPTAAAQTDPSPLDYSRFLCDLYEKEEDDALVLIVTRGGPLTRSQILPGANERATVEGNSNRAPAIATAVPWTRTLTVVEMPGAGATVLSISPQDDPEWDSSPPLFDATCTRHMFGLVSGDSEN